MALSAGQRDILSKLLATGLSSAIVFFLMRLLLKQLEPGHEKKARAMAVGRGLLNRIQRNSVTLNDYENVVAADVVDPADIAETFEDIGGMQETMSLLKEEIVLPFTQSGLYRTSSRLVQPPKGILLYGPPGCGKTLMARALAKECGCCFINVKPSTFMDKWYGESQKLVEAIFSLAEKLQPTIIFIDELDAFLRQRSSTDYEASALVKAQFMTLWDGFATRGDAKIVVVGASNRPKDIDQAILRRLSRTCQIGLPNEAQRCQILQVTLRHEKLSSDVDLAALGKHCEGYSGSDLHELCRVAATAAAREAMRANAEVPLTARHFAAARSAVECSVADGMDVSS